jgi:hypothetical protein
MSQIGSAPVTKQPNNYEIYNTFSMMGNENCLHEWIFEKRICGCITTHYNTLTDARLLTRKNTRYCCYQGDHTDYSIFLRDIAEIRRLTELHENCPCCRCCIHCCRSSKIIELRGTFGSKRISIPIEDMENLQIEISAAVGNHKLISHH